MKKWLDVLSACPLFDGIARDDIETMLACLGAAVRSCEKGETILAEGDSARKLGVVLGGTVQIVRMDYYGNRSIMARLSPSDLFAEAFACAGVKAMPVNVVAAERTDYLLIDAQKILCACSHACSFHQQMIYSLMRILATKNLAFHQRMEITSRRTTREKLMAYLLAQAKQAGSASFTIPFDRQELADYLEVDRSGLSSEIGKLRREGVIACERSRFTLLGSNLSKEELS